MSVNGPQYLAQFTKQVKAYLPSSWLSYANQGARKLRQQSWLPVVAHNELNGFIDASKDLRTQIDDLINRVKEFANTKDIAAVFPAVSGQRLGDYLHHGLCEEHGDENQLLVVVEEDESQAIKDARDMKEAMLNLLYLKNHAKTIPEISVNGYQTNPADTKKQISDWLDHFDNLSTNINERLTRLQLRAVSNTLKEIYKELMDTFPTAYFKDQETERRQRPR